MRVTHPRGFRKQQSIRRKLRSGATTVEMGLTIMVFLVLIAGFLELSIAIFHFHIVSQAARQGARQAIVRGEMAAPLGVWDPSALGNPYSVGLSENSAIPNALRNYTVGLDESQTTIRIAWPDGDNKLESHVEYRVSTVHQPFVTFLFTSSWTFVGESTMIINH